MCEISVTKHFDDRIREPAKGSALDIPAGFDWSTPMTLADGYRVIQQQAAIGAVAPRLQIAVAGQDRAAYLQGLLTNDIQGLTPGTGCYSAWLSPQGRMLTDMHVLESGGMILLDVPAETLASTIQRLEQFIFTEDVRVGSLAESLSGVWLHGRRAAAVLEQVVDGARGLSEWPEYRHTQFEFGDSPVSIVRISQLGVPGFCTYVERARVPAVVSALNDAGAVAVSDDAITAARIEVAYPVFGVDMTEETIPLEAGIESRAISFTKGCYVGQEVIIRVLHRGHGRVAKRLVSVRITGQRPQRGAKFSVGDREIGTVTSAAESPRSGAVALGYVHRDFVAPGTAFGVETPSGRAPAVVTEVPVPSTV
jgi:tRNA-modifying protein YgfZ